MRRLLFLLVLSFFSCVSIAQTVEVSVLIDRGGSGGCTVTAVDPVSGVDARLTASVDPTTAQVDALTLENCAGGSFGAPQTLSTGYPVGLNNGGGGADVVELSVAAAQLGGGSAQFAFTMLADDGSSVDQASAGFGGISFPVPLAPWALLVLVLVVLLTAAWVLRRHRGPTALLLGLLAVSAWAAHFMLDGEVSDWTGVSPISDPAGDPTAGGNRVDILAVFTAVEDNRLWFRVDLADIENASPSAADDAFATDEDTILSGENVLADNGAGADSDPDGDVLTVTGFDAATAQGATVTIAANGDLDYDPTGASALQALAVGESQDDTFTYTIEDPDGSLDTATVTVTVDGVNDAPTASDDAFATDEDTVLAVAAPGVLGNDDDVDIGDMLTAVLDTDVANGALSLNADGSFSYSPDADFNGGDSFTYHATDGTADSAVVTVTINVNAVNDAPAANDDSFTVNEDSSNNGLDVLANDTDAPDTGETLTITAVGTPSQGGTATTGGTDITYTPAPDFAGIEIFTYTIDDGNGGADPAIVTVTVSGVDDPPTAVADTATLTEDDSATVINVLANDTDVDGGPIGITSVTQPANGVVVNNGTDLSYAPNPNYCNDGSPTDDFTYTLNGGSTATVAVAVSCVNDPPVADDETVPAACNIEGVVETDPIQSAEATGAVFRTVADNVLDGDSDPVEGTAVTIVQADGLTSDTTAPFQITTNEGGSLTLHADGSFTYTPEAGDRSVADTFTYTIEDADGGQDSATVTLDIDATCVWFVDNSVGADDTGSGTSSEPFTSLVDELGPDALPDDAEDASIAGDVIYVFEGNSTSGDPYDGNFMAEADERLLGQGIDLVMDFGSGPETLFTGNVSNRPLVVGVSAGVAVSVIDVTGVEVAGLELAGGDHAVSVSGITAAFGLNLHDNEMSASSNESIVVAQSGAFDSTLAITANVVTASIGNGLGVDVSDGTLALAIDGNALISMANGIELDGTGTSLYVTSFCGNTLSGDIGGIGVVARDVIFDANPSDADFTGDQVGCTGIPTSIGSAVNPVAFAMLLEDVAGDLAFGTLDLYSDGVGQSSLEVTGTGPLDAAAGTGFEITSTGGTVDSANGPALTLFDSTLGLTLTGVTSNDSPSHGVLLNAVTGTLSVTGGTIVVSSAGLGIDATASPGVAVDFGATALSGSGIRLTSSPGADFTFVSLDVTTTGTALDVNAAGTVNIGGVANTLETTAGAAIRAQFTSMGAGGWTFDNLISDNSPTVGILLNSMTGGDFLVTGATDINEPMSTGIEVSTGGARTYDFGSTDISGAGSVVPISGGRGVNAIFGNSMSSLIFDSLNVTTDNGHGLVTNGVGLLAIGGTTNSIVASNGGGLWLENTTVDELPGGPVTGITFATLSSANSPLDGINLRSVTGSITANGGSITGALDVAVHIGSGANNSGGSGNVTYAGSITNTVDNSVLVQERTGGAVTLSGNINDTGSGILVQNNNNGVANTITFSGSSKVLNTGANTAVLLDNNDDAVVSFTGGGLDIDTSGAVTAFNAINGGTVQVTGAGNSVNTTAGTGVAVNINATTIGATGVTFQRIDVSGAPNGIVLDTTGVLGGFTVTGVNGPCGNTGSPLDCDGGVLQNTTADAIALNDTDDIALSFMRITNIGNMAGANDTLSGHDGIDATDVNGLDLTSVSVDRISDSALKALRLSDLTIQDSSFEDANRYHLAGIADGTGSAEGMLFLRDLGGTNTIDNSTFEDSAEHVDIENETVDLDLLTVQRSDFGATWKDTGPVRLGKIGIDVITKSGAGATVHIGDPAEASVALGNSFLDARVASIRLAHFDGSSTGQIDAIISRNNFTVSHNDPAVFDFACTADQPQGGVVVRTFGTPAAQLNAIVSHNTFDHLQNADGRDGSLSILFDDAPGGGLGGVGQVRVTDNAFVFPYGSAFEVAEDGTTMGVAFFDNNTITGGPVTKPACFVGFPAPAQAIDVFDQGASGTLHVVVQNMTIPTHDTGFDPGAGLRFLRNNAGTHCVVVSNVDATEGFQLARFAGTFNLEQGASAVTGPISTVMANNGNTGTVSASGTINVVGPQNAEVCARPAGGIFTP